LTATSGTLTQATSNSFNITAAPPPTGDLTVTAATTGHSLPSSYTATVDGDQRSEERRGGDECFTGATSRALGNRGGATLSGNGPVNTVNGVATFANHTIDKVGTCYTLTATSGTLTQATSNSFNITAAPPPTGDLTVTAATTGQSLPSSYTVTVDGDQSRIIGANGGSTTYTGLSATDHTVALTDVPANCTASGGNSKTVTVPAGGTGHADFTITCAAPNQPPTAAFTSSCGGLTCSFTDQSTDPDGSVIGWSWNFGDGATSNSRNPSHPYGATGDYTVTLTVTDDAGASSAPVTHSVSPRAPNQPPT